LEAFSFVPSPCIPEHFQVAFVKKVADALKASVTLIYHSQTFELFVVTIVIAGGKEKETRCVQSLLQAFPDLSIRGVFTSMRETLTYFKSDSADLLLLDTELSDASAFALLSHLPMDIPVILWSDSAKYAVDAFRYNCIYYLSTPIQPHFLQEGLEKFRRIRMNSNSAIDNASGLFQHYRKRFVIRNGNKMKLRNVDDAALFFADGKTVYLVTKNDGRKYIVDHTLQELERTLHPEYFFRINRKHIVSIDSISEINGLFNGKLGIKLSTNWEQELCVSREKSQEFKQWLNR
jgi:DNA-binding LytR/AlgR family response regulator